MNRDYVVNKIEEYLNGTLNDYSIEDAFDMNDPVEAFLHNTAIRLMVTYKKYCCNEAGEPDLKVSLRNFLLSFQVQLKINNLNMDDGEKYGIFQADNQKYYASYEVPEFIKNDSFVKDCFVNENTEIRHKQTKYSLVMNSFLKNITGFEEFKSIEQKLSVYGALNTPDGYSTLISMPTGGGKSLVTQALGYAQDGLSIVIVPTISLAIDQERAAKKNIKCAKEHEIFSYYSGTNNFNQILEAVRKKSARLLFISPEALLKNEQFRQLVQEANASNYIKNIIIDEAHIVVAWGDFFRIDYQCLGPWRKELLKSNPSIRTFLLSATFKDYTVDMLKRMFSDEGKWVEIRCDSLRKEPRYIVLNEKNAAIKKANVLKMIDLLPRPMILYVNAPYEANRWQELLFKRGYKNIKTFTGETKSEDREKLIDEWIKDEYDLMIATSAFGVGVDKPDVRTVLHVYVPESPDSYYQELGRGGRDGLNSLSVMCVVEEDLEASFKHVSKVLTTQKLWGRWWSMYRNVTNQWQGSQIAIMASTKPNYNKNNYFEEGNDTDEKWNINVLLMLSRQRLIEIDAIDMDHENRYIFTIRILNDCITQENDRSYKLFDEIREKEANRSLASFNLMANAIHKIGKMCWSEMFYETYPLVSELCSGCDSHSNMIADETNRFPLLVDVSAPEKTLSPHMLQTFSDTNELLVISDQNMQKLIEKYKPDVVVSDGKMDCEGTLTPSIQYMNFAEFRALQLHDNGYYITGLIMAFYDEDVEKARNQYQTVKKYMNRNRYVIHVSKTDFIISKTGEKKISEQIDGAVVK